MKKILFAIGVLAMIILGIFAVSNIAQKSEKNSQKIRIVTTLFPLFDFAKNIGGDKVETTLLLPPGVEAHTFEPKPSDIVKINEADLFVFTGKFMEPWAQDLIKGITAKGVKVVDASMGIELIKADPHIWLDFDNAKMMVDNIAKTLAGKDPANADFYLRNATDYENLLTKLDNEYMTDLGNCQSREIIYGGHFAFGYLAKRYNLKYTAAQGVSPDAEPTAQDLVRLVEQIKKDNIQYVFYEELTSPKIAETLASETKVKMLLLNAAHNITKEDFENKVSFISIMQENLANLKIGLQCTK